VSHATADKHSPIQLIEFRRSFLPSLRRFHAAPEKMSIGKFQDLRTNGHDRQQESTGGNPLSGQEKPELSRLVLFTPRNNLQHKLPSGDETNTENESWKCAFN
jgi:hypothetical protein